MADRPDVPEAMVRRIGAVLTRFPECREEPAWVGTWWRVGSATVAHVFGGEDQLFRITFRAEPDEVMALEHLGPPYFRSSWGRNVVGMLLDERHRLGRARRAADRLLLPAGAGVAGGPGAPAGRTRRGRRTGMTGRGDGTSPAGPSRNRWRPSRCCRRPGPPLDVAPTTPWVPALPNGT